MNRDRLKAQLIRHEGVRAKAYRDSRGVLTIGVGRNIATRGLSPAEIDFLLMNDIDAALRSMPHPAIFERLNGARQEVLVNMCFNLGAPRLAGFKRMWAALDRGDYEAAAYEMRASRWADQVGARAGELSQQMRAG